ncbi:hypothetical protein BUALT_Bualt09G0044800 [Buddleja alternifolia]|uniref:Uncharacterized protein n=1 Tax=Buddleja alternifolia TaxID=168488 RepID=A0AAV6X782_9LAMI|nr:hypothetical protein BUALT_Bualt09G0044800 [Buddleja alternifolia]
MNTLDSPLEALALNYLNYALLTAVNSIWAWVAVITAAVSFWRIRALSSPPEPLCRSQDAASETPKAAETAARVPKHLLSAPMKKTSCCVVERESSTKTKFSLYYEEDYYFRGDDGGGESEDGGDAAEAVSESENVGRWCDDWERMMVVRMGDMGWYRWQDTTVLDGSVVRLWDGGRRRRRTAALLVDGGVRYAHVPSQNNRHQNWVYYPTTMQMDTSEQTSELGLLPPPPPPQVAMQMDTTAQTGEFLILGICAYNDELDVISIFKGTTLMDVSLYFAPPYKLYVTLKEDEDVLNMCRLHKRLKLPIIDMMAVPNSEPNERQGKNNYIGR